MFLDSQRRAISVGTMRGAPRPVPRAVRAPFASALMAVAMRSTAMMAVALVASAMIASAMIASAARAAEPAIEVVGRDGQTARVTAADMLAMPRVELSVADRDGTQAKFAGVELRHLLAKVEAASGDQLRGPWIRCVILVDAADGYRAVYALPEADDTFSDRKIVVVDRRNGQPLDGDHGPFRMVLPSEKKHSRWIRMITRIQVVDTANLVPIPASGK